MRRYRVFALLVVALMLPCSAARAGVVTMDQLWPNEDGREWRFDQRYQSFGLIPQVIDNQVRLLLDGTTVAPDGIDTQYLRHELLSGSLAAASHAEEISDPFLRELWQARPDLRVKLRSSLDGSPCPAYAPAGAYSTLLNGEFAYLKTGTEIAAWRCNFANTRSWRWLTSNLTLGSAFTLQLVPDFANNVFLHGTVAAVEPATVPAGTYPDCVRVDYVIDYGQSQCTDENGAPTGTMRALKQGYIHYAPNVGPIQSFEEFIPFAEMSGYCGPTGSVGAVAARTTMKLAAPSVPALPMSWGRVKTRYR